MADTYANFEELKANEVEGEDYAIISYPVDFCYSIVFAPHGGGIEVGTSEVIRKANEWFNFTAYEFEGKKSSGNSVLHITSTNWDEPIGTKMVKETYHSISLHGYAGDEKGTYIGGRDSVMMEFVREELKKKGFLVHELTPENLGGDDVDNIVNKNMRGAGVQLELSTGQRKAFFKNDDWSYSNRDNIVQEFYDYVFAIINALYRGYTIAPLRILSPVRLLLVEGG